MSPQRDNNKDKDMASSADRPEATIEPAAAAETTPAADPAAAAETDPVATAQSAAEPPAPAAEPAPAAAAPAAAAVPSGISGGGAFVMGVFASVLVLGALGAAGWATLPQWQPKVTDLFVPKEAIASANATAGKAVQQATALDGRIGQLEQTLGGLRTQLAAMEKAIPASAGGAAVDPARVDALSTRVAALETAPRFDPAQLAAVRQAVDGLAGELAAVKKDVTGFTGLAADLKKDNASFKDDFKQSWAEFKQNSVAPSQVLKLTERIDAAEAAVKQAQSRTQQAQALLIATGQLREAIYRGAPFDAELRAIKLIAGQDTEAAKPFAALDPLAGKGVATRGELASRFGEMASAIIRADVAPEQPGWWRQTVQSLTSVVTIRRIDGEAAGDSVAALVGRAEANLEKGDLAGAVHELSTLQGAPAEVAAPWVAKAKARLAAEQALSNLTAHAVAVAQAKG